MLKAIVLLALLVCVCFAADPVCEDDSDCHDLISIKTRYCNQGSSTATCSDQSKVTLGTTVLDSKRNYCDASYLYLLRCVNLHGEGCPRPAQTSSAVCAGGNWNGTTCQLSTSSSPGTYKAAGESCDFLNPCGFNLVCRRKICYKLPPPGEFCLDGMCTNGNSCNLGRCTPAGSLPAGSGCDSNSVCSSGSCSGLVSGVKGFCNYGKRNQRCYTNRDCPSSTAQCDNRNKNSLGQGICFDPYPVSQQAYSECVAAQCSSQYYPDFNADCAITKCEKQFIFAQCAAKCPLRPDLQYDSNLPYRFDCKSITRTKLSASECGISNQFINCDSYYNYQNSAFTMKSSWMFVLAAIAVVLLMI